jgi:hypothetical protein
MNKFYYWSTSFKGATFIACFCLFAMFVALSTGAHPAWAIADAVCCVYWVWIARRAVKGGSIGFEGKLNPDQEARIKAACNDLAKVMEQVDSEMSQARREKAETKEVDDA